MMIRINGEPVIDIGNALHHMNPIHVLDELNSAPNGLATDFYIISGLSIALAAIDHFFLPDTYPRLRALFQIVAYVVVGAMTLADLAYRFEEVKVDFHLYGL